MFQSHCQSFTSARQVFNAPSGIPDNRKAIKTYTLKMSYFRLNTVDWANYFDSPTASNTPTYTPICTSECSKGISISWCFRRTSSNTAWRLLLCILMCVPGVCNPELILQQPTHCDTRLAWEQVISWGFKEECDFWEIHLFVFMPCLR